MLKHFRTVSAIGALLCGCGGGSSAGGGAGARPGDEPTYTDEATVVHPTESNARVAERADVAAKLDEVKGLSSADLVARYPFSGAPDPSYDLAQVAGFSAIQASAVALGDDEQAALRDHGFVISRARQQPSFLYAYG